MSNLQLHIFAYTIINLKTSQIKSNYDPKLSQINLQLSKMNLQLIHNFTYM